MMRWILNEAQNLAAEVLEHHEQAWERLAQLLLDEEAVDGERVLKCFE